MTSWLSYTLGTPLTWTGKQNYIAESPRNGTTQTVTLPFPCQATSTHSSKKSTIRCHNDCNMPCTCITPSNMTKRPKWQKHPMSLTRYQNNDPLQPAQIIGKLSYYARAVNSTLSVALSALAGKQNKPTLQTKQKSSSNCWTTVPPILMHICITRHTHIIKHMAHHQTHGTTGSRS